MRLFVKRAILIAGLLPALPALAGEAELQARFCKGMYMEDAARTDTRADCVSANHAIEIAPSDKWAEALGRVLLYSRDLGVKPGIILACAADAPEGVCRGHAALAERVFFAWGIAAMVWRCPSEAQVLADCVAKETQ